MTPHRDLIACEDSTHCITCSDAADRMRIVSVDDDGAIGVCVDDAGRRSEVLLGLTPDARPGAEVLVHAGVALSFAAPVEEIP